MPKIYNKIINSPTPPKNTSDIWECNGRLYLYKGGGWESIKTDSEYYELPFDFCTLMLLHQEPEGRDPIQINSSEISKAIKDNKIIVMRYDMYGPGGYVLVSGYEDDLIYLSAVMGTDLLHWEFTTDEEFIYPEAITYKVIGEGGSSQSDWRAGEDEDGYIKNKPFGINYNAGVKLSDYDVLDFYHTEYDETVIELDYWGENSILYTDYYNKTYIEDIWNNAVQIDLYNGYSLEIGIYTRYDAEEDWDVPYVKCCIWTHLTQEEALEVISIIRIGYEDDFINKLQGDFIDDAVLKASSQYLTPGTKNVVLDNLGIDLIDFGKKAKIIIDFNRPGNFTFKEYGIDLATSNGVFLMAMVHYLTGESELESLLVDIKNAPKYDSEYSNSQGATYISHTYIQYLEDYEKEFGYEIDILNKTISIWGV